MDYPLGIWGRRSLTDSSRVKTDHIVFRPDDALDQLAFEERKHGAAAARPSLVCVLSSHSVTLRVASREDLLDSK